MLHFATLFDKNYLSRGLVLYSSLKKHSQETIKFYILALDKDVQSFFETQCYSDVILIPLEDVENFFPDVHAVKSERSLIEYYFTLSPILPLYILKYFENIPRITTLDADIYFFNDPSIILTTYPNASILITPHSFTEELIHLEKFGKFNVSFQSFKNDVSALACLENWKEKCLQWCYDFLDEEYSRFADQKYLDEWADEFKNVESICLDGAGLAPWNIADKHLTITQSKICINGNPLIYYHFHQLRTFNNYFALSGFETYRVRAVGKGLREIYHQYFSDLRKFNISKQDDNKITRLNKLSNQSLITKLMALEGFWFSSKAFSYYIRPHKIPRLIKRNLKKLWPI